MRAPRRRPGPEDGFTLAEAAVTIAIVSIVLLMVVQGLQSATRKAYYTKVRKTAHELAQGLLGEVRCGLYRDEMDTEMSGTFADQDEPDYRWEIVVGEDVFEDRDDEDRPFDNFAERRRREDEREESFFGSEEEDEEQTEPFEKVKVKVIFPVMDEEQEDELILEAWVPWVEIYGPEEEEELGEGSAAGGGGAAGGAASGEGDR